MGLFYRRRCQGSGRWSGSWPRPRAHRGFREREAVSSRLKGRGREGRRKLGCVVPTKWSLEPLEMPPWLPAAGSACPPAGPLGFGTRPLSPWGCPSWREGAGPAMLTPPSPHPLAGRQEPAECDESGPRTRGRAGTHTGPDCPVHREAAASGQRPCRQAVCTELGEGEEGEMAALTGKGIDQILGKTIAGACCCRCRIGVTSCWLRV